MTPPPMLARVLARHRWTAADLARAVGLRMSAVHHWQHGRRVPSGPSATLLALLDTGVITPRDLALARAHLAALKATQ